MKTSEGKPIPCTTNTDDAILAVGGDAPGDESLSWEIHGRLIQRRVVVPTGQITRDAKLTPVECSEGDGALLRIHGYSDGRRRRQAGSTETVFVNSKDRVVVGDD